MSLVKIVLHEKVPLFQSSAELLKTVAGTEAGERQFFTRYALWRGFAGRAYAARPSGVHGYIPRGGDDLAEGSRSFLGPPVAAQ